MTKEQVIGGLLGLATGDAFGVPVEFMKRTEVERLYLRDMVGSDTDLQINSYWGVRMPAGAWSDDTAMTVASMASIIRKHGRLDYEDQMAQFTRWWGRGDYTSTGKPFGLGGCVESALNRYKKGIPALECGGTDFQENGNGSLMRIFPISMLCVSAGYDDDEIAEVIGKASSLTHAHDISKLGCFLYTKFLATCLETKNPQTAYKEICTESPVAFARYYRQWFSPEAVKAYEGILAINPDEIPENGYIVTSLKIALYSILKTWDYEDAVETAVNFGYDTDTNCAITGSIAGALYGIEAIPQRWLKTLKKREYLKQIAGEFFEAITEDDMRKRKQPRRDSKDKKGSGFEAPAIGVVIPEGLIRKQNPDGTTSLFYPDGKEWRP